MNDFMEQKRTICYFSDKSMIIDILTEELIKQNVSLLHVANLSDCIDAFIKNNIDILIIESHYYDIDWIINVIDRIKERIYDINSSVYAVIPKNDLSETPEYNNKLIKKIFFAPIGLIEILQILDTELNIEMQLLKNKQHKILIIDDNDVEIDIIKKILSFNKIETIEAKNGEEAKKFLNSTDISLILCDIFLPYINGFELCRMFKEREFFKSIPFIAITSSGNTGDLKSMLEIGANDFIFRPFLIDEFLARIKVHLRTKSYFDEIQRGIANEERLNRMLLDLNEKLNNMSITDFLTGIYNRRYVIDFIINEIVRSNRYKKTFCLMMIDIDHFKQINDNYGHIFGDEVLIGLTKFIKSIIRQCDVFARFGGEEFIVVFTEIDIKNALIAEYVDNDSLKSIIGRSDTALYRAKENGRNRIEID